MPTSLVDGFCHGEYNGENAQLTSVISWTIPADMESETAKAFRM